ncbi:hypothetical protein ACJMK2_029414 [Sinanodonta woodiana]|uniref:Uncharacterized protein n=1 Tax=Sinanodonta woodiana TaxID=1069815 RepID=A0ABD3XC23_SINWO
MTTKRYLKTALTVGANGPAVVTTATRTANVGFTNRRATSASEHKISMLFLLSVPSSEESTHACRNEIHLLSIVIESMDSLIDHLLQRDCLCECPKLFLPPDTCSNLK